MENVELLSAGMLIRELGPYDYSEARGKYPPAKPGALGLEPLEAAEGVADAAPRV
jgi:hypothetical protein